MRLSLAIVLVFAAPASTFCFHILALYSHLPDSFTNIFIDMPDNGSVLISTASWPCYVPMGKIYTLPILPAPSSHQRTLQTTMSPNTPAIALTEHEQKLVAMVILHYAKGPVEKGIIPFAVMAGLNSTVKAWSAWSGLKKKLRHIGPTGRYRVLLLLVMDIG